MIDVGTVVQFNENHKWCGCLGIVTQAKLLAGGAIKYMVHVPIPPKRMTCIFVLNTDNAIDIIGLAVLMYDVD